jgi:hypothetical protein
LPIFNETGVLPAPPTTMFPMHITGKEDFFDVLAKFLILVPKRNNNDKGYNERDR